MTKTGTPQANGGQQTPAPTPAPEMISQADEARGSPLGGTPRQQGLHASRLAAAPADTALPLGLFCSLARPSAAAIPAASALRPGSALPGLGTLRRPGRAPWA